MLPHAPGVQMANIPDDGIALKEESEVVDEANPDKRMPQQIKDKVIEADNEFEDSTKSGNRNECDSGAANSTATANDSSKTKGVSEGGTGDTVTKKTVTSNDTSDNIKGATGKGDDKDEPMEVDSATEKDDKSSKSGSK